VPSGSLYALVIIVGIVCISACGLGCCYFCSGCPLNRRRRAQHDRTVAGVVGVEPSSSGLMMQEQQQQQQQHAMYAPSAAGVV
jgi:hypothetical protein